MKIFVVGMSHCGSVYASCLSELNHHVVGYDEKKDVIKKIVSKLDKENVARDIIGYPKAPPSLRLWGGATVQNNDMKSLLPWIDWSYTSVKNNV